MFVISEFQVKALTNTFECMTEWTVPEIVQQSRRQRNVFPYVIAMADMSTNNGHEQTSRMEDPNTMGKA